MSYLGSLSVVPNVYDSTTTEVIKSIDDIQEGYSQDENFLYVRCGQNIKIYDRVCDHNGGRLSLKDGGATCPLHGWNLDLSTGVYVNARCTKKPILEVNEYELDSPLVYIPLVKARLVGQHWISHKTTEIRFLNHACLLIKMGEITFATDPWIYGGAFCNGWWLAKPSPSDAFEKLNKCDFIYISHNHPDHLHPESLREVRKDMPILTADFASGSTADYLDKLGFMNIYAMDFVSSLIDFESEIQLTVLKSGDFRDDSGLFVQHGKFRILLTVDSNFLNFGKLPTVDLMCSSFAGGATGFPLCFENYSEEEKEVIVTRNRGAMKVANLSNIKAAQPSFFMPYAGFFTEAAERDIYIKQRNIKNSVEDFESICASNRCSLLNINQEQIFVFDGSNLVTRRPDDTKKMDSSGRGVITSPKDNEVDAILNDVVLKYFEASDYKDKLLVDLRPVSDDFTSESIGFMLDFDSNNYSKFDCESIGGSIEEQAADRGLRYLRIKVRRAELLDVVTNGKPWEDIAIGFQCRIYRNPNIYNSDFWFYFTNIYIGKNVTISKPPLVGE